MVLREMYQGYSDVTESGGREKERKNSTIPSYEIAIDYLREWSEENIRKQSREWRWFATVHTFL